MKNFIRAFLISISTSLCLVAQLQFTIAQTASILPQAETQFLDNNGKPVTSGTVDFYIPNSSTRKSTWQDAAMSVTNTNPVKLDGSGRALIYGYGGYRQVLKDRNGNLIWDRFTNSYSIPNGQITTGDGNNVGTILQWSALTAPNQYVFAYGQELARVTYPDLFSAITLVQNVNCTSSSNSLSGVADTSQIPIGAAIEASCFAASVTVTGKTSTTYTVSANATVTTTVQATVFPFGNGNATSTFNVPDLRGRVLAGRDNMGGIAASRLTTTYFANASAIGATGGLDNKTLVILNLPPYTPSGPVNANIVSSLLAGGASNTATAPGGITVPVSLTAISTATISASFVGAAQGGTSTPFSIVQPTVTVNYIIKVTADQTGLVAAGVQSIQAMGGIITCNNSLTCASQVLGVNPTGLSAVLDSAFSSTQGSILYRGASAWAALPPGNSGNVLATMGAAQNPVWAAPLGPPVGTQARNNFYAGPTSGSPTTPGFRLQVNADLPWPLISTNTASAITPSFAPDQAHPTTGLGGVSGDGALISNGVQILNFSSATGATVGTPTILSNNTQIATACYVDREAGLPLSDNGSTASGLILQATAPCTLSDPPTNGTVVSFVAPVSRAKQLKIFGSSTFYPIRDPAGITQVEGDLLYQGAACDICKNSNYRLKWNNTGSFWQLITPTPQAATISKPIQGAYLQNGDATSFAMTFSPYVYDPDWQQWKWASFYGSGSSLTNFLLDGTPGQSLIVGHMYHLYAAITPGNGGPNPGVGQGIVLDAISRYFDYNLDPQSSATFSGYAAGGTLTITSAITGTVLTGMTIQCTSCETSGITWNQGSWLTSGAGVNWAIAGTAAACSIGAPCTFRTIPPKYYPGSNGVQQFYDAAGNLVAYVGACFVLSLTDNTSYFDRTVALTAGGGPRIPGATCQSSFASSVEQQTLTIGTTVAGKITGPVPGTLAELVSGTGSAGFKAVSTETLNVIQEWTPKNDYFPNVIYTCGAGTTTARLQVTALAFWVGSGSPTTILYDESFPCSSGNKLQFVTGDLSHSFTDGAYVTKILGSADGTGTTFTAQPAMIVRY